MRAVQIIFSNNVPGCVWMICFWDAAVWCLHGIPFWKRLNNRMSGIFTVLSEFRPQVTEALSQQFSLKKLLFELGKHLYFKLKKWKVKYQYCLEQFHDVLNFNVLWKIFHSNSVTFRRQAYFLMAFYAFWRIALVPIEHRPNTGLVSASPLCSSLLWVRKVDQS